jgi:hypothetical protein
MGAGTQYTVHVARSGVLSLAAHQVWAHNMPDPFLLTGNNDGWFDALVQRWISSNSHVR